MKRLILTLAILVAGTFFFSAQAEADFGLAQFDFSFEDQDGAPATQAGSHPFALNVFSEVNYHEEESEYFADGGDIKDLIVKAARGFTGDTTAVPRCTTLDFATLIGGNTPSCQDDTVVGVVASLLRTPSEGWPAALFNLVPPPGIPVRLGFSVAGVPIIIDISLKQSPDYNVVSRLPNIPQPLTVFGGVAQLWGVPADPAHDFARGKCMADALPVLSENIIDGKLNLQEGGRECPAEAEERPFLTLPRVCEGPLPADYELDSWSDPGAFVGGSMLTHDFTEPPNPIGFEGCDKLEFLPGISSAPTADTAETSTGLDFELDFEDEIDHAGEGLVEPDGLAQSDLKKITVTLPEGVTINPSIGEGLGVCTPADLDRETLAAKPGEGCPNPSKIGTTRVDTPAAEEPIDGSVYLAQQDDPATSKPGAENPFDTLIAFYIVIRNEKLGILVKIPAKVEPDPHTGQLVTTVEDAPQTPFNRFLFHFREGQRAPLVTPPRCGTFQTKAEMTPWARPSEVITRIATFTLNRGIGGAPCPSGGVPSFHPAYEAGANNNNAGSFSPFYMRLIRSDGEQDMTKFSSILPPGEVGSLVGVGKCPDSAVAIAKAKTGRQEIASPSCPANSLIGHTLAGAGVGSALTYVPGKIYLGGPYHGDPLSVIAITPAVAGPFDAGTVVVQLALTLNSKTAEVEVDGAASDPIPHILNGIILKTRDLRVYVDRPSFLLNPTSCDESSARATLFGSYLNVFDSSDDVPVDLKDRYQAANCLALGFKPKLDVKLKGGSKRGGHPGLLATYRPRKGDANIKGLVVRLPRSAFLDQAHIRTICTRVQFAAKACPKAAQYGYIKAYTPLLEEPLEGPAYLRSSNHKLPDLVFDLHGLVNVEVATRIDSVKGGIRATVEEAPDAPLSKVVLKMQGQKKGLIINSRDLCTKANRANVRFEGHNGKVAKGNPVMEPDCGGKRKSKRSGR